ncbi:MAG: lipoprotein-releasing system ATP-binding protein LolD [Candidatus Altiarchaeales archaeon]|nr:MAG: lipoprotein-releasing system ATP-binding protein LolD [Candidatus Altiarchaeales archaeon]HDI73305.1 ABC transporter ATP-binding protein [Candidatus Altiarchaeales archaeon]
MENQEPAIIKLEDVWKIYHMGEVEVPALRGLNLEIYPGEFVAIMGPSGSGKSTAMNMIGCLDVPTRGHIFLEGQDISRLHESDLAQIRGKTIGFIFQTFNLMPGLTALENVMLPMTFQGIPRHEREMRAEKLLNLVGLSDRINHKPTELSGGQQQRVAIARSLANDPEVILADEPTGNLDTKTGREVMEMLSNLHREEKKVIIMVTHDQDISQYAERILHLRDGRIVSDEENRSPKIHEV